MRSDEYRRYDALGLATLIEKGEITNSDALEACEERIDAVDPSINAVVSRHFDIARAQADDHSDRRPFFGTPFGAKEEGAYYNGIKSGAASKLLPPEDPEYTTNFARRYQNAGLNLVAKLNMPELAVSVTTESKAHGICQNPWDLSKSTGGSSGGSAAAVAAGYFPAAYGNDGAGSIRIPASCCGVFGFKPSRGRVPKGPILNDEWAGNVVDHVITRSVRDSAAILDISAGPDIGAPYSAPYSAGTYLQAANRPPQRPLKIALCTKAPTGGQVHTDCISAAQQTAALCDSLGHIVEEAEPPLDGEQMFASIFTVMCAHVAKELTSLYAKRGIDPTPDLVENTNYALFEIGSSMSALEYLNALTSFAHLSRTFASFFETYDLLLTPTLALPSLDHGYITTADTNVHRFWQRWTEFIPFTPIANIAGQPAMSMPLYWNAGNIPVGSHFIAPLGAEATLFNLAGQLEAVAPWHSKYSELTL